VCGERSCWDDPRSWNIVPDKVTLRVESQALTTVFRHMVRKHVCFITAGPITKLCAWGEEESGGHVL
jgi:hypothetical protein